MRLYADDLRIVLTNARHNCVAESSCVYLVKACMPVTFFIPLVQHPYRVKRVEMMIWAKYLQAYGCDIHDVFRFRNLWRDKLHKVA